jgi:small subunit ribosomal protein S5
MSDELVKSVGEVKKVASSRTRSRGRRSSGARRDRRDVKEFEEVVLNIARVTRVVKGGRRMRFLATVVIGDKKGKVGLGTGKSVEVSVAIKKAVQDAKKNLISVDIVDGTIPFAKVVLYKSVKILLMPAPHGTGVIAGGAFRKIATLAGITDIYAKSVGTNSKLVSAQASIKALRSFTRLRKLKK